MSDKIASSDIRLSRFSRENADLVLSWRNAPNVRANCLNDAEITRDDHIAFVDDLSCQSDRHFFILHINGHPEAVFNIKLDGTQGLWGCYIGAQHAPRPGLFPVLVAVSGSLAFDHFSCAALKSEVLVTNSVPQRLNSFIGVRAVSKRREIRPSGEELDVLIYTLERADWSAALSRINGVLTQAQRTMITQFRVNLCASIV